MNVADLLMEGLRLMGIGMGIVFAFLLLLVGVMRIMSGAVGRFAPSSTPAGAAGGPMSGELPDAELVAVISAAVARYRRERRRKVR